MCGFCLVVEFLLGRSGNNGASPFSLLLNFSFIQFDSAICRASICCPNPRSGQLNLNYLLQTLMDYWLARRIKSTSMTLAIKVSMMQHKLQCILYILNQNIKKTWFKGNDTFQNCILCVLTVKLNQHLPSIQFLLDLSSSRSYRFCCLDVLKHTDAC